MLIDPALIALSNETACTITPGTAADLHTLPTTQTTAVRQPDLVLEPSSGPTRSTAARACEWTCDPDAFGLTTCFFFFQTLTASRTTTVSSQLQKSRKRPAKDG